MKNECENNDKPHEKTIERREREKENVFIITVAKSDDHRHLLTHFAYGA